MKKLSDIFFYFFSFLICILVFYFSDLHFDYFKKLGGVVRQAFIFLPFVFFFICLFISSHFNKTRIFFISLLQVLIYILMLFFKEKTSHILIIWFLLLDFIFFRYTRDSGILTLPGIFKFIFIAAQSSVLFFYSGIIEKKAFITINSIPLNSLDLITKVSILNSLFLMIILTMLYFFRKNGGFNFTRSFSADLILLFSLLTFLSLTNTSLGKYKYLISLTMNISSLLLIISLYFSTWDKVFTDELTGLLNRRAFDATCSKLGKKYTMTMMDIDHFKNFNDKYGHQAGDEVLQFVSGILKKNSFGRCYRYGGEEFVVITPGKEGSQVLPHADFFRRSVEGSSYTLTKGKNDKIPGKKVNVTISLGIACSSSFRTDPVEVIQAADAALYRAKKKGRNRVEIEKRKKSRKA
ncbi:MAG: hypothetical protein C0601_11010 [Candidatus Muiribacterium halophilum]|uniref:GGDEF domain-containing protein n=1 Tax=Muiribacterium halophilum TaxID=2053465 RepID=A0A2N5ZBW2_MUIH1|nr:MAG: hypothetical protein C0601_11010 [Candidatus Muirbacterium halophilum]